MPPTPTPEGPYVVEHGEIWFVRGGPSTPGGRAVRPDRVHVCGPSDALAVAYDEEDGTLHKHGSEASVRKWIAEFKARTAGLPAELAPPVPAMLIFAPNETTVAEMNRCIATSGYVLTLQGRPAPALR